MKPGALRFIYTTPHKPGRLNDTCQLCLPFFFFFPLTTKGEGGGKRKGMRGVGGVRRASEAEQCGLADNIKEHNLGGASANLVPATPHTQPSIRSRFPSPHPCVSSLSLRQISSALSASQRYCYCVQCITRTRLPSPPRCLAGAHMINDICHSVRREGWVSDVWLRWKGNRLFGMAQLFTGI